MPLVASAFCVVVFAALLQLVGLLPPNLQLFGF